MKGYEIQEVPCEMGGRGFRVWPHGAAEPYHVHMVGNYGSCECKGWLTRGGCKHINGVKEYIRLENSQIREAQ